MQSPHDVSHAHRRFLPFVRFVVGEGWEIFRSRTGNLRLLKAGLPPIHIGLAINGALAKVPRKQLSARNAEGADEPEASDG